jgi:hypothetical protein
MQKILSKLLLVASNKKVLVILILIFGAVIRFLPLVLEGVSIPFRSGGLFLEFSRQILLHGYRLPPVIPFYSDGGIPFAYPPLPFYFEGFLLNFFPNSEFVIANVLPPTISMINLVLFYILTREYQLNKRGQLVALVAYATMPVAFISVIESAGLAEAFGSLALIMFAFILLRTYKKDTIQSYIASGLFLAICIVASPGSAYASIPIFIVFAFVQLFYPNKQCKTRTFKLLIMTGFIALALSSPYWLTVINNHGIQLFVDSIKGQYAIRSNFFQELGNSLIAFNISHGYYHFIFDVIIFYGCILAFIRRRWGLLICWFILFSIPREGIWMMSIPASILAGIGADGLYEALVEMKYLNKIQRSVLLGIFCIWIILNPLSSIQGFMSESARQSWPNAISAMYWVRENLPADSKLVVITDSRIREWVPHLAQRTVLNVPQGLEWKPVEQEIVLQFNDSIDRCLSLDNVFDRRQDMQGYSNVYFFIDRDRLSELMGVPSKAVFDVVWENSTVVIGTISSP